MFQIPRDRMLPKVKNNNNNNNNDDDADDDDKVKMPHNQWLNSVRSVRSGTSSV